MMNARKQMKRLGVAVVATGLLGAQITPAYATMVSTPTVVQQTQHRIDRDQLMQMLERDSVQAKLRQLGVDPAAAKERVAAMTDEEVRLLNARIADMPAGGDVLGVALVVFIVFIVTDMLGATDIFSFVHPIN